MIRPININLNAAHPELPLVEATTFTGAPSSVFIRGVPKAVGNWSITAVSVAVTYPDNTTTARAAVESAEGVWVATIPGTATSGRTAAGFKITADGIDENGAAVTGYVLGFADFSVLSFTPVPAPGGTFYLLRYFDQAPATPKKGDVAKINGLYCIYNGTAWDSFGDGPGFSTDDPLMDGEASPGSAETAARSDHVHPSDTSRASTADATLTERGYSDWSILHTPLTAEQKSTFADAPGASDNDYAVSIQGSMLYVGSFAACAVVLSQNGLSATYDEGIDAAEAIWGPNGTTVATRTALQGYQLGSQDDKPLASEAEAEALRTGKQDALSAQQLANIAAVSDALAFDATHSYAAGDPVVYNGTLYTFTTAHTGAWTGSDVSAVDIIARLAGKLDKVDPNVGNSALLWNAVTGSLEFITPNGESIHFPASALDGTFFATTFNIPYDLGTPTVIDAASSETVEGETVYYGAATLADRTANIVQVTAATALDELRITFPAANSGKVRDFGLRVEIGTGSAALTAPALVPIAPTGETIKIENADRAIPELADGTATAKGVTLLYFSETAPGVFVVKGEQVEEVA